MSLYFFFNDTATTEIYTLSLHDALPISVTAQLIAAVTSGPVHSLDLLERTRVEDRKSTRLNSSHQIISYAVFCLKKKKNSAWPSNMQARVRPCMASICTPASSAIRATRP